MSRLDVHFRTNLLLGALSDDDLGLLKPYLERVRLKREQVLVTPGKPIGRVFFLEGGVASIVSDLPDNGRTEVGIFGAEGMSGTAVLLGTDRSPNATFMQVGDATALAIATDRLLAATDSSPTLRAVLLRFVQVSMIQTAHSAAANAHQRIEARLARWLLMCHDRVEGDEIPLTHEFMGMMIAAQRSGVTVTLHILEGAGMIRSKRGRVIMVDRPKLEELAGDGYGLPEAEYRRLIGPFGRSVEGGGEA